MQRSSLKEREVIASDSLENAFLISRFLLENSICESLLWEHSPRAISDSLFREVFSKAFEVVYSFVESAGDSLAFRRNPQRTSTDRFSIEKPLRTLTENLRREPLDSRV